MSSVDISIGPPVSLSPTLGLVYLSICLSPTVNLPLQFLSCPSYLSAFLFWPVCLPAPLTSAFLTLPSVFLSLTSLSVHLTCLSTSLCLPVLPLWFDLSVYLCLPVCLLQVCAGLRDRQRQVCCHGGAGKTPVQVSTHGLDECYWWVDDWRLNHFMSRKEPEV